MAPASPASPADRHGAPGSSRRRRHEDRPRRARRLAGHAAPAPPRLHARTARATAAPRRLAEGLAAHAGLAVTLSLAGRTASPAAQAVPVRIGGFGGAEGLADYLAGERIEALIDATHPYAAAISANAAGAAGVAKIPLLALRRPP